LRGEELDVGVLRPPRQHLVADHQQAGNWIALRHGALRSSENQETTDNTENTNALRASFPRVIRVLRGFNTTGSRAAAGSTACRPAASDSRRACSVAPRPVPGFRAPSPSPSIAG